MAKGTFDPEIKQAMAESPADRARDKARGIKEGSPQDEKLDAMPQNQAQPNAPMGHGGIGSRPPGVPGAPPHAPGSSIPHINAAASIAHAILNRS